jgi:hypothetical protein
VAVTEELTGTNGVWVVKRPGASIGGIGLQRVVTLKVVNNRRMLECSCRVPTVRGVPCKDVMAVIKWEKKPGTNEPMFSVRDMYDSRLTIDAAASALSYNVTAAMTVDTHNIVPDGLRPHPPVLRGDGSRGGGIDKARIPSKGETRPRKGGRRRKYRCRKCKTNSHTAASCKKNKRRKKKKKARVAGSAMSESSSSASVSESSESSEPSESSESSDAAPRSKKKRAYTCSRCRQPAHRAPKCPDGGGDSAADPATDVGGA